MDIGKIGVLVGLGSSVLSILLYLLSLRGSRKVLLAARASYAVTALSVFFCFGRLMYLVSHGRYEYKYVFEYTSPDLRAPWTYAATWAGQEGSFLLWALWTAVIGLLVAWKAGKWESRMMPLYITVITFLFAILAWLSPYNLLPRGGAEGYPMDLPWPPTFGKGLHPSLQNYWMAIHPPTIFFGFASLAVPFCYAVAAMIWRDYGGPKGTAGEGAPVVASDGIGWAPRVMPWVLLTTATLGIGLFMGGYWAYETQGWHGFWAWDPVENASLFPWLGSLGLLHGLVVEKSRGGMARTNIFLAIFSFLAFLWGTYLTRSGVLGDFSVHSFVSLASQPLSLIIGMIGSYFFLGTGLLIWRWRKIPGRPISDKALSRDTAMVLAVSLMILAAVVVGAATSWPLLSRLEVVKHIPLLSHWYSKNGMAAQPTFYNKFGSTVMIPTLIIMGIVPFLAWGKTNAEKFLGKVLWPWFAAVAGGAVVVYFVLSELSGGVNPDPSVKTLGFTPDTPRLVIVSIATLGMFAMFANVVLAARILKTKSKITLGGWLAHVGIGMLMVGTVITNVYEKTEDVVVVEGEKPADTKFGYALQFDGWSHDATQAAYEKATDPKVSEQLAEDLMKQWRSFDHHVRLKVIDTRNGSSVARAGDVTPAGDPKADGSSFIAEARIFRNNKKIDPNDREKPDYMRWPYIHKEPFRDFYVSVSVDPKNLLPSATFTPGEAVPISYAYERFTVLGTDYVARYKRFYMEGTPGQAGTTMRAEIEVQGPDGRVVTATPGLRLGGASGPEPVTVQIPELQGAVRLNGGMDAATKQVTAEFEFADAPRRWVIPIQVTNKPMINLVWLGVIVMGLGTVIAMFRRSMELRKGRMVVAAVAQGVTDDAAENAPEAPARPEGGAPASKPGKPKPARART